MNYQDIQSALAALYHTTNNFNEMMEETGGEYTPEAEELEGVKNALEDLLSTEGVDSLGRWLKAKEDEKATYKAEKAACDRRIKSVDKTIDFIKQEIGRVLRAASSGPPARKRSRASSTPSSRRPARRPASTLRPSTRSTSTW